jgi:hypothetical protein
LITPPLASNFGIAWLPAGPPGAVCADAPAAPNPSNPVKTSGNAAFISHLRQAVRTGTILTATTPAI